MSRSAFAFGAVLGLSAGVAVALGQVVAPAAAARLPRPTILSAAAVGGGRLVAVGKRVDVIVRVRGATSCSFSAQHAPLSSIYPVRTVGCGSGHARVTMPAVRNPSGHEAKLIYRVRARGRGGTSARMIAITVAAALEEPAPPPPLPDPPPAPPGITSSIEGSTNWSGYAMTPGPYTAVGGSFNVPALQVDDPEKVVSEWVGVDGFANKSLIQAGVEEEQDVALGRTRAVAWWEILPAAPTPIPVPITPGDQVTVAISQLTSTSWRISLTNDTTGRSFTTDQPYVGPGGSAEWIVEAPSLAIGLPYPLAPYLPAVTFRNLAFTGPENTLTEIVMHQGHDIVSTPSVPSAVGFSVAYGATAPPAP